jgi:hypothetical protein
MIETKNVSIYKIEQKASKNGKSYWSIETSSDKFSVWDADLAKLIKDKALNKQCEVGYQTSEFNGKTYYNMVSLEKVLGPAEVEKAKVDISESARLRRRTDCVIAAKDLVIAKVIKLEELLDKAQGMFNWIEGDNKEEFKVETIKV